MTYFKIILAGLLITAVVITACNKKDSNAPIVVLNGKRIDTVELHKPYIEVGATANDSKDGDLTASITITGTADTATTGFYTITYHVTDKAGNVGEAKRTVMVRHTIKTISGSYAVTDACVAAPSFYNELFQVDSLYLRAKRFGNYDSASVYVILTGQTNTLFVIPQQTLVCGIPPVPRIFAGTGTISPNGKNIITTYAAVDAVSAYTCIGSYVK